MSTMIDAEKLITQLETFQQRADRFAGDHNKESEGAHALYHHFKGMVSGYDGAIELVQRSIAQETGKNVIELNRGLV